MPLISLLCTFAHNTYQKCEYSHILDMKNVKAMFIREITKDLINWKSAKNRKPLIVHGARQVGKTWILKYFGKEYFEDIAYFSLDKDESGLCDIFKTTKDPKRILEQLSFLHGRKINPQSTLLILDEIQECNEALNALKYFCEETPEYAVICAGSLLGIYLNHIGNSFPVGKVDHMYMYPLTFTEFLQTKDQNMYGYMCSIDKIEPLPQIFYDKLKESFIAYSICGGMPEPATLMLDFNNMEKVDNSLQNILNDYTMDFVKHTTPALAPRINYIWNSLPSQLAKENRKFIYQLVRPGARAREYEDAIFWLQQAGLVNRVTLCKTPKLPLKAYDDLSTFKLYTLDVGLLRRLSELDASILLTPSPNYIEYKGALAENYILQSLTVQFQSSFRYWTSGNKAKIDFLLQFDNQIYPIEVKADQNTTGKSLIQYEKRFSPQYRIRYSMLNLKQDGNLINIPLFLADKTKEFLRK